MSKTGTRTKPYDFGASISQPLNLPGGKSFLLRVLVASSLLLTLLYATLGRSFFTAYAKFFQSILKMEDPESPEATAAMIEAMSGFTLPMIGLWLGAWLIMASAETAFHKNIFHGVDHGLFPLRFAMPELGVWVAQLVVGLIVFGVYFAGYLGVILLFVLAAFSAEASPILAVIFGIITFGAFLIWIAAIFIAAVRLSPAAALSVRDGDIRTVEGWAITKGRFWAIFGGYAVVWIAGYVASLFVMVFAFFIAFGGVPLLGPLGKIDETTDPSEVFQILGQIFASPRVLIGLAIAGFVMAMFGMFWRMFTWGIPNYVVQRDAVNAHDVFSDDDEPPFKPILS